MEWERSSGVPAAGGVGGVGGVDAAVLVIKVWRDPGFRARVTVDRPESGGSATKLFADHSALLAYLSDWLEAPQRDG